jgi:hypothetical protein
MLGECKNKFKKNLRKKIFPLVFSKEKNDGNGSGCLACSLAIPYATSNVQFFLVLLYCKLEKFFLRSSRGVCL